ncbi:MAG: hypothetical protein ACT4PZ_19060 [Panacagrimonas sp.]
MSAMSITDYSIELAVLGLFRDCGMGHPAGRVLMAQLERRWRPSGFRRSDLYDALDRLEISGCVSYEPADPLVGVDVVLLTDGYRRLGSIPLTPGGWFRELLGSIHIFMAGSRDHTATSPKLRRRRDDEEGRAEPLGKAARMAVDGRLPGSK